VARHRLGDGHGGDASVIPAGWLNAAWMIASAAEACHFRGTMRYVAAAQSELLADLLRRNCDTAYGRAHRFGLVRSPREFQDRVPLTTHVEHAPFIERVAAGEPAVMTREPVELLEPTGGTTSGEKLIPFTATLRRQFRRAVAVWIHDLFHHLPAARRGRAYWSVSPSLGRRRRSSGGIPIGFDEDAAYLGGLAQWALDGVLVRPRQPAPMADLESFRFQTLAALLGAHDLALVSVWSPTFLTALLAALDPWTDRLLRELPPGRARDVAAALAASKTVPERLRLVWPRLALVSCWADGAAARFVPAVHALFPHALLQPKGLLATEGVVSIPLLGRTGAVLAIRSHFFEFEESERERPRLAHELDCGGRYRVVLTTGGGLYRYRLGDEIEVVGFEHQCPLLRFCGRADRVSDLVGEKLTEPHVHNVLDRAFATHGLRPTFAMLVPELGPPPHYVLFVQGIGLDPPPAGLRDSVRAGLNENPYYHYAVGLGQLGDVSVELVRGPAWRVYEERSLVRGQKAGAIKPATLDPWTGWAESFRRATN
jgi:hypothetical protein